MSNNNLLGTKQQKYHSDHSRQFNQNKLDKCSTFDYNTFLVKSRVLSPSPQPHFNSQHYVKNLVFIIFVSQVHSFPITIYRLHLQILSVRNKGLNIIHWNLQKITCITLVLSFIHQYEQLPCSSYLLYTQISLKPHLLQHKHPFYQDTSRNNANPSS